MKTLVLYHANCWDGFCAAWIARGVLRQPVEFIPVQYGEEPPSIPRASRLYILDFCYPRQQLLKWNREMEHMIVLDHHKTAQQDLAGFSEECKAQGDDPPIVVFDMEKSGARLTWEHFYRNANMKAPWLVDYTEDRDLWRWKLMESRKVNAALRSYPLDFEIWDNLHKMSDPLNGLCWEGAAILRREQQIIDQHVKYAREIEMDGHKILSVNASVLFSEIAGELAKSRPFGACWFQRQDGKRQWSLRSEESGVDVSAVAKKRGGGGHAHAAGFEEDAA